MTMADLRIAVLVPCYNEEAAVATVVADFGKALPVGKNLRLRQQFEGSHHRGRARGRRQVRSERRQGKGHVVRRMFADIDADVYVLVDGDATYERERADA